MRKGLRFDRPPNIIIQNLDMIRCRYYCKRPTANNQRVSIFWNRTWQPASTVQRNIIIYTITCARLYSQISCVCVCVYETTTSSMIYINEISVRVLPPVYNVGALPWLRSRSKGDQTACRYTYPRQPPLVPPITTSIPPPLLKGSCFVTLRPSWKHHAAKAACVYT